LSQFQAPRDGFYVAEFVGNFIALVNILADLVAALGFWHGSCCSSIRVDRPFCLFGGHLIKGCNVSGACNTSKLVGRDRQGQRRVLPLTAKLASKATTIYLIHQ
jgi:hypothetical protein